jgi:hypothetical protein
MLELACTIPTQQSYSLFEILPSVHYIENIQSARQFTKFGPSADKSIPCRPLLHQSYGLGMTGLKVYFRGN